MAEILPIPRQTFEIVPENNPNVDISPPAVDPRSELISKFRTLGSIEAITRNVLLPIGHPADPNFISWDHMAGHEGDEDVLAAARSQGEFDAMVGWLERNRQDHYNADHGPMGLIGDLMAGIADPINLTPMPWVKGIGAFRAALVGGTALGAIGAGEEYLRQKSDPLARPEEALWNIGLSAVLGAGVSAPIGAWGAGAARRASAIRAMEHSLSDADSPNFSLRPRGVDEGMRFEYGRPPPNPDGSYPRFKLVDDVVGYETRTVQGVSYAYDPETGWTTRADAGRAEPLSVSDDIAEQLGQPTPIMGKKLHIDEAANKLEHARGEWHDELGSYVDGDVPIERIVLDGNDFNNFRTYEHLAEMALPRKAGESLADWRLRVGKQAMREFRASKLPGNYAGPRGLAWILERLNFSPVAKLINTFAGDNYVADLALRVGGDYGWAIKGNKFGWSTPPSILLKTMRHTARYQQWQAVFDAEFLKFASGNQGAQGRVFQGLNIGAAGYNRINGVRRMGGAKVMTKDIFEEMTAEAVFNPNDFETQGFPVNENARNAAKAFTQMAQEYDDLHRAAGNFRDQKKLNSDIRYWKKQEIQYKNAVMKWLWGETSAPRNLLHAIKVNDRIFTGASHDEAIQNMMDALGDEGIALSENLTAQNYGYTYHEGVGRPPLVGEPAVDLRRTLQPGQWKADSAYANFTTTGEALDHLIAMNEDSDLTGLARMIRGEVADIPFRSINAADAAALDANDAVRRGGYGRYDPNTNDIMVAGEGFQGYSGANTEVVLHEAFHGATHNRIEMGLVDIKAGLDTPRARAVKELQALHSRIFDETDFDRLGLSPAEQRILKQDHDYATRDIHELVSYGLTSPVFRRYLESIPYDGDTSMWQRMWEVLGKLFGIEPKSGQLGKLMEINDQLMKTAKPEYGAVSGELFIPDAKAMEGPEPAFVTVDDAMDQRVRRLTPAQRAIYDERAGALAMAQDNLAKAEADLKLVTDVPHQMLDAAGKPEPWYHRVWDKMKGATEREQLTRLITKWYERDNPDGARGRAEQTVDNILNGDAEIGDGAGMSALRQRQLNMPNSWSIDDPQFGTIKVADFIDKRIRSVAEHYIHRSGAKIETARMFGDSEMRAEKTRLREYLMQRYYEPAANDNERAAAMAKIEEAEGWLDIINKSVAGTLRTTDPWRLDNRIVRGLKNITTLGVMGKVEVASLGEILRPGMIHGYGTFFNTIFTRYLDDLEAMRGNLEMGGLTAELNDLSMNRMHVQQATIQDGEPSLGGTSFERWINEAAGNLYNIAGLTSLTTWQKTMTGLAAQHTVMADARLVGEAVLNGAVPDAKAVMRLGAMGINERDAALLARMPVEHYQGGKLILPAVDAWKTLGADGRRARELLLNGIHAEMRRAIVTPSIGDRSTIFNGVWTRKGKVVWENDLMTLPMQFLSYGMGAHNKFLTSAIQGRDRSTMQGVFYMFLSGILAAWLLTDKDKWRAMTYDQILAEGYDRSGVGGFWFNGINSQIERVSNGRLGLRAMAGIDPTYKRDPSKDASAMLKIGGAAPSYFYDLSRAFWDNSITGSQRAAIIRRGVPYNNVYWWDSAFDTMGSEAGDILGGKRQ